MCAPVRVGDGSGRQVAVDAGDGRRHAADRGAGPGTDTRGRHEAIAHPHAAGPRRALDDIDVIERLAPVEDDDLRASGRTRGLPAMSRSAPTGSSGRARRRAARTGRAAPRGDPDPGGMTYVAPVSRGQRSAACRATASVPADERNSGTAASDAASTRPAPAVGRQHPRPSPEQPRRPAPGRGSQGVERGSQDLILPAGDVHLAPPCSFPERVAPGGRLMVLATALFSEAALRFVLLGLATGALTALVALGDRPRLPGVGRPELQRRRLRRHRRLLLLRHP